MIKQLMTLAAALCCAMTLSAQSPLKKTKMSPWLLNKYQQQQTAVKQNGGPLKVKGRTVRNYILTLVESTDKAAAVRAKGGVVFQDFGEGICAAFLPTDSLGVLNECPTILCMEANEAPKFMNDTSAIITGTTKAWDFENALTSDLKLQTSSIPQAFTGKGVIAAIEDTGFDFTHPAFRNDDGTSRIKWFWDPLAENDNPDELGQIYTTPEQVMAAQYCVNADSKHHGSHVLGSMAGRGLNGRYMGMAPEADIMGAYYPLDNITAEFDEKLTNYLKRHLEDFSPIADNLIKIDVSDIFELVALKKIFDVADAAGQPCVVNWSFGSESNFYYDYTLYEQVVNQLVGPGHIVVAAAGNDGDYCRYLKKEAGAPLEQKFYCSTDLNSFTISMRTKMTEPFFDYSLSFNDFEETITINTEDSYNATEALVYDYGDIQIEVNAFSTYSDMVTYSICIKPQGDYASYLIEDGLMIMVAKILIGADTEVELMGGSKSSNFVVFTLDDPTDSRGCNLCTICGQASLERLISVGGMHHRSSFTNIFGEQSSELTLGSKEGQLMSFSACGPTLDGRVKPDVVAPGHNIISALNSFYRGDDTARLTAYKANVFGKDYAMWGMSGTSMSAPIAAGIIALWLQAKPDLTPEDILGVIARTSHQPEPEFSGYEKNIYYGYGEIDAYAGLLDILQLTDIPELSHHQPAGLTFRVEGSTLYIDGLDGEAPITLFDLSGRPVLQTVTSGTLQLPNLAAGVYAVQLGQLGSTLIRL